MTDHHVHRRDDEENTYEHERRNDMPSWMRWGLDAIQKVGFPAVMCLLIWWKSETTQRQQLEATMELKSAMKEQATILQNVLAFMTENHNHSEERWDHFLSEFRGSRK